MKNFFTAITFCTRIPVPARLQKQGVGFLYFLPFVGALIGLICGLLGAFLLEKVEVSIASVLLLIFYYGLTGCLHLDGLADCADAFYGNRSRERILEIMKDPRIGTMGTAAIALSILLKYVVFQELDGLLKAMAVAFGLSRVMPLFFAGLLDYARREGGVLSGVRLSSKPALITGLMLAAGFCAVMPVPCLAGLSIGLLFLLFCRMKINGYTGDCMGAAIEIVENTVLLTLVIL